MNDLISKLQHALAAATDRLIDYEAAAAAAQARLAHERAKAEKLRDLIGLLEVEMAAAPSPHDAEPPRRGAEPPQREAARPDAEPPQRGAEARGRRHRPAETTKRAQLRGAVAALLGDRGSLHRSEILDYVQKLGMITSGRDPLSQLAAFLHKNRDLFAPDGKGYFSLQPAKNGQEAQRHPILAGGKQASVQQ
jgi:hypothetical protein